MRRMKMYILDKFKYREYGQNFMNKMKRATDELKTLPTGYETTGFESVAGWNELEGYLKTVVMREYVSINAALSCP